MSAVRGLVGRQIELAHVAALVREAGRRGAALVVEGDVGTGKTALLGAAVEMAEAEGYQVLGCAGTPVESRMPHAGLHELLYPVIGIADDLPGPQRSAVRAAFGAEDAGTGDAYATSLAVLGLLQRLAVRAPVLLVVDDVRWMDEETVRILCFIARRLTTTPIVLLIGCRTRGDHPLDRAALPRLTLSALSPDAAEHVLDERRPRLTGRLRDRVLTEAGGNPLALIELHRALVAEGAQDPSAPPRRLPLTARLRRAFTAETATLPAPARLLLLVAAAEALTPAELAAASRRLGLAPEHLAAAEQNGLVTVDSGQVTFTHPLLGSALYDVAPLTDRIAVHRLLAEILSAEPHRAAWHRAAGTIGQDESAAAALQAVAGNATDALLRAAELTPDAGDRARRLARAAEAARSTGRPEVARLLAKGRRLTDDPALLGALCRTEVEHLRAAAELTGRAHRELIDLAYRAASTDVEAAGQMLACAAVEFAVDVPPEQLGVDLEEAVHALRLPACHPLRVLALALLAPQRYAGELAPALRGWTEPSHANLLTAALAADRLHDIPAALRRWGHAVERFRAAGETADLLTSLSGLAQMQVTTGRLSDAAEAAREVSGIATDLDRGLEEVTACLITAHVHAWRGETAEATDALDRARCRLRPAFPAFVRAGLSRTAGMVALAHGRADQAYAMFSEVVTPGTAAYHPTIAERLIAELAESAVLAGLAAEAGPVVERLAATTGRFDAPLLRLLTFRARALLATETGPPDAAAAWFRRAVAEAGDEYLGFEAARTRLCYGRWLRRTGRAGDARAHLAVALAAFESSGAELWRRRAETELRAAGGVGSPRELRPSAEIGWRLTRQELEISRLAAAGLTNREIAERLYLSHRTVGVHLFNAYPKLGVRSREQLERALAAEGWRR
ncbi:AAA family ATPase [Micromonospora thermarum]|uniref:AAA family ATPase n=1 Tax=Micromonospora thermarum TaxID=2720024 RepID=A0ABX0Z293_9ACTN|nr:LuxR family transcriptional regulator [Micromonospora thermarum]NJP31930.1 AAA family ATPase [Micromonospora thermarum]